MSWREEERREKDAIYSGHLRLCQQPRAAHGLRLDQKPGQSVGGIHFGYFCSCVWGNFCGMNWYRKGNMCSTINITPTPPNKHHFSTPHNYDGCNLFDLY